ncbi:MAG: T9SS type A sorting domain-containing protein [Saprospiraceae bacterium]|nr:T9SS type A sorting domain-containing protein [Saprospiraceae bacterium]
MKNEITLWLLGIIIIIVCAVQSNAQDPAIDKFERSVGLGSNWTVYFGGSAITIIADSDIGISNSSTLFGIAAWTGSNFEANQYSEAIISSEKIDSMWAQVFVRRRTSDAARYAFHWSDRDGKIPGLWDIKYDGVPTPQTRILDSLFAPPPAVGDTLRIEVRTDIITGYPEIKGYHNDKLVVSAIDSTRTKIMNGAPGMVFRFRVGFNPSYPSKVFEEWEGGSLKTITGINNNATEHQITLFPNPVNNELKINFYSQNDFEIEIFNTIGKIEIKNRNQNTIDVSRLPSGFYFLNLKQGVSSYKQKFIKK